MKITVLLTKQAIKDLKIVPQHIVEKLQSWISLVEFEGLKEARHVKGYHDEPLKGKRKGQRSIRLSRSYRAIYIVDEKGSIELVKVLEVNKHEY